MVVVLVLGGWLGWVVHRARGQREVVAAIRQAGGAVWYDDFWYDEEKVVVSADGKGVSIGPKPKNWTPHWLVDSIGIDYLYSVVGVRFNTSGADEVAGYVARLPRVDFIFFGESDLSDSGLACLRGLNLRTLLLSQTKVTNAGVQQLRSFTNLEELDLSYTSVGDAEMVQVATFLPKLERLSASNTNVTDLSVRSIVRLPALTDLDLSATRVGDKGAALLALKAGLKDIHLSDTRVSPEAIQALRDTLPDADVW
jgi:Leucine Rich repeat